jgi:salicylate hydroxylase
MAAGRTVYIAGAGIAGLTLALALAKFGASVVILERNKAITELGAGVQLSPNARKVLNQLGLDKQVAAASLEPDGIDVFPFGAAKPLVTLALGPAIRERYGAPYAVMHRADLAELLHRACRRFASIDIAFDVRSFAAESGARGVTVSAEEAAATRNGRAFAFVGADGVNSPTRTQILGGRPAIYSGTIVWRTTIPMDALDGTLALDRTSLLMGPGYHAVCYPLPHRKMINVALFARHRPADSPGKRPAPSPSVSPSAQFSAILNAAGDTWSVWPLATVVTPEWSQGAIGLIGDAAHAMLPFQAQGAAMAIEDAGILAPLLMTEPTAEAAFARFSAMRMKRVARVARLSARNAAIFHMDWPLTLGRDLVMRLQGKTGHLRRLDWVYSFDIAPEVETTGSRP